MAESLYFVALTRRFPLFCVRSSAEHKKYVEQADTDVRQAPKVRGFSNVARKRSHRDCGLGDSPRGYS